MTAIIQFLTGRNNQKPTHKKQTSTKFEVISSSLCLGQECHEFITGLEDVITFLGLLKGIILDALGLCYYYNFCNEVALNDWYRPSQNQTKNQVGHVSWAWLSQKQNKTKKPIVEVTYLHQKLATDEQMYTLHIHNMNVLFLPFSIVTDQLLAMIIPDKRAYTENTKLYQIFQRFLALLLSCN